ncbi:MAG: DUF2946 family protein [Burkholderiales bacterium]
MCSSCRRFAAWIALFAVSFAAAFPAAAAARHLSGPLAYAQVCRSGNADAAADVQQTPAPRSPGGAHPAHCPFCSSGDWQAPAVSGAAVVVVRVAERLLPATGDDLRPHDATAFSPTCPRAPPRLV